MAKLVQVTVPKNLPTTLSEDSLYFKLERETLQFLGARLVVLCYFNLNLDSKADLRSVACLNLGPSNRWHRNLDFLCLTSLFDHPYLDLPSPCIGPFVFAGCVFVQDSVSAKYISWCPIEFRMVTLFSEATYFLLGIWRQVQKYILGERPNIYF